MRTPLLLLITLLSFVSFSQEFTSTKQRYNVDYENRGSDWQTVKSIKTIKLEGSRLDIELFNGTLFTSEVTFDSKEIKSGKSGKLYNINNDGIIIIYEDEIFLNLKRNGGVGTY